MQPIVSELCCSPSQAKDQNKGIAGKCEQTATFTAGWHNLRTDNLPGEEDRRGWLPVHSSRTTWNHTTASKPPFTYKVTTMFWCLSARQPLNLLWKCPVEHMLQFYREEKGEKSQICLAERMDVGTRSRRQKGKTRPSIPHAPRTFLEHCSQALQKRCLYKHLLKQKRSQKILRTLDSSPLSSPIPMPAPAAFWAGNTILSPQHSAKLNLLTGFGAPRPKGKMLNVLLCSASFCAEQQVPTFGDFPWRVNSAACKLFLRFNTFRSHVKCKHISTQLVSPFHSTFDKKFASC